MRCLKKYITSFFILLCVTLALCSCGDNRISNDSNSQQDNPTITEAQPATPSLDDVYSFVENSIKSTLKNPTSLIVNNITNRGSVFENTDYYFYAIDIDYSAQNGFGGYNRESQTYYLKQSKNDFDNISIVTEKEYYNLTDTYRFESKLLSIENSSKIPYHLICRAATYSDVDSFLKNAGIEYTMYYKKDTTVVKELQYPCTVYGLDGVVTITFHDTTDRISSVDFCKYGGQFYYDANKNETIFFEDSRDTTLDDVEVIINDINKSLSIEGKKKQETSYQSNFENYLCTWDLSEAVSVKVKYDVRIDDKVVDYLAITFSNSINGVK